ARGMRMIAGKVLMDRHAPAPLLERAVDGYHASKALIARWHGKDRLAYAVTPRFAPTSTPEQLAMAGALLAEHPGTYLQTHLAETRDEVSWVAKLFADCSDYLEVYEKHGLVQARAVFGHGVHLDDSAWQRLHAAGAAVAHCPTSNNFLGSGHFRVREAVRHDRPVHLALGTDVGAGTTLSMLATMGEAYKVARHTGSALSPTQALWLATAGGARALDLAGTLGALAPGHDADVTVLDLSPTPLIAYRMQFCESIDDALGVLMMLGDDRAVRATYVAGRLAHRRAESFAQ
ncbi:MAG TPA: guanine deaminase, partial [Rudaea sp.]|nr:guanine deaminase [Rudaea sp.]